MDGEDECSVEGEDDGVDDSSMVGFAEGDLECLYDGDSEKCTVGVADGGLEYLLDGLKEGTFEWFKVGMVDTFIDGP